jgi:hypothetical protein
MCGINKEQGKVNKRGLPVLGKLRTSYFDTETTCVSQYQTEAKNNLERTAG